MKTPPKKEPHYMVEQCIYLGPRVQHLGLGYAAIFKNGIHPGLVEAIKACPALGGLFIRIADAGNVRRELAFDYAHNMKGTTGRHVTFYREVQNWIAHHAIEKTAHTGITLEPKHA